MDSNKQPNDNQNTINESILGLDDLRKISDKPSNMPKFAQLTLNNQPSSKEQILPIPGESKKNLDEKFSGEIYSIKHDIDSILLKLDSLESVKNQILSVLSSSQNTPRASEEVSSLGNDEIDEFPELPVEDLDKSKDDTGEYIKLKDKLSIKGEVDSMITGIRKVPVEKEISSFGKLIRIVPALNFLKPRFSEVLGRGEADSQVLVGLYRIASRFLQDELENKEKEIQLLRSKPNIKIQPADKPEIADFDEEPTQKNNNKELEDKIKELTECIDIKKEELEKLEQELEKVNHRNESLQNDFNNYRNRQSKEVERQKCKAREDLIIELLRVIDNLERAIEASGKTGNVDAIIKGFNMIYEQFRGILKKFELVEIPAEGLPFDPHVHEALTMEETFEHPEGTILFVLRKGYMLGDKLLRPTQVKTAKLPTTDSNIVIGS
jgi:molecular chaperone GrpE (heat shock protein)